MRVFLILAISIYSLFGAVGKISAMSGDVVVLRADKELKSDVGFAIEKEDTIKSGANSKAQLMFDDNTVVTIGKESIFKVIDYFNDESNKGAEFEASKGFFKVVTGGIGKVAPDKFKLQTKTATIGIRGTHILASISDEFEKVACVNGAISVTSQGVEVAVLAGEISSFKSGEKPTPAKKLDAKDISDFERGLLDTSALSKKIDSIKLGDEEGLKSIFDEIRNIKESDVRVAMLDRLESNLNEQLDELLAKDFKKSQIGNIAGIDYGFYTEKEIRSSAGEYLVDEVKYSKLNDAILQATPKEMWLNGTVSESSDISNLISTDKELFGWEFERGSKKIIDYSGEVIGFSSDSNGKNVIQNGVAKLTLNYADRAILGNLDFYVDGKYSLSFSSLGDVIITPTSFYSEDFYAEDGSKDFLLAQLFYTRYFGKDAKSVGGYFEVLANDVDINDPQFDKNILGMFVATTEKIRELKAYKLDESDFFEYGFWAEKELGSDILASNPVGAWIKPKDEITPKSVIENLIGSGAKISYSGDMIGTGHNGAKSYLVEDGKVNFNMDFKTQNLNGDINFNLANEPFNIAIKSGEITTGGFKVNEIESNNNINGYSIGGKFYSKDALAIGGGVNLSTVEGTSVIGAFSGVKK